VSIISSLCSDRCYWRGSSADLSDCSYKLEDDDRMQEPFFPITWTEDGYRSPFISKFLRPDSAQ
jgi:hypothetical protein